MEDIFRDLESTKVYIDDIGAFSDDLDWHLQLLEVILDWSEPSEMQMGSERNQLAGVLVNPHRAKTLEEENQGHSSDAKAPEYQTIALFHHSCELLLQFMALTGTLTKATRW